MTEQLVPLGPSSIFIFVIIGGYRNKNTLMQEQTIGTFWDQVQFIFYFFPITAL